MIGDAISDGLFHDRLKTENVLGYITTMFSYLTYKWDLYIMVEFDMCVKIFLIVYVKF